LVVLWIGVDDTDSLNGMCTTYVGAVLERRLLQMGCRKLEYSHLIRLNPNCPHKTRGNAAVSLHIDAPSEAVSDVVDTAVKTVEELYEKGFEDTQPGIVIYRGEAVPDGWRAFAVRAVREMVELEEAEKLLRKHDADAYRFNGGRGIIGALAAIACPLPNPTYEAIAYRVRANWGTVRRVDKASVVELYRAGLTFDSYDPEKDEVRVTPHTPCPVLAGVRALTAENALKGLSMLRFYEEIELFTVYATNQATDMHLTEKKIAEVKPYSNAVIKGWVVSKPVKIAGGHVFFRISDGSGELTCACYRPTGGLRDVAYQLRPGDEVRVMGGVKPKPQGNTLNVEKLEILSLSRNEVARPPRCPICLRRMTSAGAGKGFKCRKCGLRLDESHAEMLVEERLLEPGVYEVAVSARRHLSRPICIS